MKVSLKDKYFLSKYVFIGKGSNHIKGWNQWTL